jgi:hypothetical protein
MSQSASTMNRGVSSKNLTLDVWFDRISGELKIVGLSGVRGNNIGKLYRYWNVASLHKTFLMMRKENI